MSSLFLTSKILLHTIQRILFLQWTLSLVSLSDCSHISLIALTIGHPIRSQSSFFRDSSGSGWHIWFASKNPPCSTAVFSQLSHDSETEEVYQVLIFLRHDKFIHLVLTLSTKIPVMGICVFFFFLIQIIVWLLSSNQCAYFKKFSCLCWDIFNC